MSLDNNTKAKEFSTEETFKTEDADKIAADKATADQAAAANLAKQQ